MEKKQAGQQKLATAVLLWDLVACLPSLMTKGQVFGRRIAPFQLWSAFPLALRVSEDSYMACERKHTLSTLEVFGKLLSFMRS